MDDRHRTEVLSEWLEPAPRRGYYAGTDRTLADEQRVIREPEKTDRCFELSQPYDGAIVDRDLSQLPIGDEGQPAPIRTESGEARSISTIEGLRCPGSWMNEVQRRGRPAHTDVGDVCSIRRDGDPKPRGGGFVGRGRKVSRIGKQKGPVPNGSNRGGRTRRDWPDRAASEDTGMGYSGVPERPAPGASKLMIRRFGKYWTNGCQRSAPQPMPGTKKSGLPLPSSETQIRYPCQSMSSRFTQFPLSPQKFGCALPQRGRRPARDDADVPPGEAQDLRMWDNLGDGVYAIGRRNRVLLG